jgi:hypothetical protein
MKIIEALKRTKDLQRKADDIRAKIAANCADLDADVPTYGTVEAQSKQIQEWLQAHSDILKEIENLRLSIQRTNLAVIVSVEVTDGKRVEKSIAAWIHRRKDLAKLEASAWAGLTNRNLKPQNYKVKPTDEEIRTANIRKYYSQQERDKKVEEFTSEPSRIDAALEISNAVTDLVS